MLINNNGPKNLLRNKEKKTSYATFKEYNDAIFEKCSTKSAVVLATTSPAEFIANGCLYAIYSVN